MPKKVDLKKRHEDLARAAVQAICKNGLADVTLAMVARESGWSIGALTHYIKSKDELLLMAAEYSNDGIMHRLLQVRAKYKGLEALRHAMYLGLPCHESIPGIHNIWFGFWDRSKKNEKVRRIIQGRYNDSRKRCTEYVKQAQKMGELPDDVDISKISRSALMVVEGVNIQCFLSAKKPLTKKEQIAHVDDWITQIKLFYPVKR